MRIEIIGHHPSATCSLTGKKNVEVFGLRVQGGEKQLVSTTRLPETLRLLCCVGNGERAAKQNGENGSPSVRKVTSSEGQQNGGS